MKSSFVYRSLLAGMAATGLVGNLAMASDLGVSAEMSPQVLGGAAGQVTGQAGATVGLAGPGNLAEPSVPLQHNLVDRTTNQMSSAAVTAKVKAALLADDQANAFDINVDTDRQGQVTLRGTAPNDQARQAAAEAARHVRGVVSVDNQLTVSEDRTSNPQTLSAKAQAEGEDGWLATKVKTALTDDRSTQAADVDVSTRHGHVILTGTVPTETARRAAIQSARAVKGVKRVDASALRVDARADERADLQAGH